ncbi:Carbon-nitrogen hydrolase [Coccidioides posadasii str. Silveira]|uniref:N-terminal asparagine amidohydrolase n=3 Tax=Coccidioides posadasii TaxID=199306 RepID=E9CTS1_COCPS|nr:hydrolase, carbon-nitrogen family protein [Coccidioides posadasii C735 delta SOWgp]EER27389.1 hydrolase, carbon-nitrogen family protein [Coccidioides posadasii C735 delta SOWgp]EFW23011.1 N-terminal asparagine amidohydrolase [Coccidioides posadasii str. Silveira]KMM67196.1 amino-terminal amidase NTA1 [Coccidioides posadasii RMSCC 3488]QVM11916.1 Carbon-nitrogen hydrolase [Coccidioides posadasii str. Silveira]|eukprot:XP_003069534.1 hydrolase, carbon-nitrogen family protein [Coccidioides posadasii C735 delta SOWgp]
MRIATLQFSPRLRDVEGNIERGEEILNKWEQSHGDEARKLDLLVLPEMAFTGYNFSSLETIKPYLEPTRSGPTAKWARSTARRLGCVVCVGYPEIRATKSDQTSVQESSEAETSNLEHEKRFNSLIIEDSSGNTLLNYQKCFLYYTDEPWASEGENGKGYFPLPVSIRSKPGETLSNRSQSTVHIPTAVGICMDINPYKFIAPYTAYEFATHVLDSGAKLVIVSMAWLTWLTSEELAGEPQTPDTDTFQYWIQRFWPLITRDSWDGEEIIIVFANRTGEEEGMEGKDTARYAGTSCVIGIRKANADDGDNSKEEERRYFDVDIVVWERLGRAEEGVCFVDTDLPPKMVFKVVRRQGE